MSRIHEILQILTELEETGDFECAHLQADDLLIEVLKLVWRAPICQNIIDAYENVGKWYA